MYGVVVLLLGSNLEESKCVLKKFVFYCVYYSIGYGDNKYEEFKGSIDD